MTLYTLFAYILELNEQLYNTLESRHEKQTLNSINNALCNFQRTSISKEISMNNRPHLNGGKSGGL